MVDDIITGCRYSRGGACPVCWHRGLFPNKPVMFCVKVFGFRFVMVDLHQEQTLLLQKQSQANQLTKLGEVQKRFGILSRQCSAVKQAHEKLEQNGKKHTYSGGRIMFLLFLFTWVLVGGGGGTFT